MLTHALRLSWSMYSTQAWELIRNCILHIKLSHFGAVATLRAQPLHRVLQITLRQCATISNNAPQCADPKTTQLCDWSWRQRFEKKRNVTGCDVEPEEVTLGLDQDDVSQSSFACRRIGEDTEDKARVCLGCLRSTKSSRSHHALDAPVDWLYETPRGDWCRGCHNVWRGTKKQ